MAIVKCKVCGKEIDEDILKCPGCDSLGPKRGRKIKRNFMIVGALMMVAFGIGWYKKTQETVHPIEEVQKEALEDKNTQRALAASLLVKSRLAHPDSMKVTKTLANEDASNICFEYTETDAAGKTRKSRAVVYDSTEPSMKPSDWKLFCEHKSMQPVSLTIRMDPD